MNTLILAAFILLGITFALETCPKNSVRVENSCNTKCSNIAIKEVCTDTSQSGCKCTTPGYYMTNSGKCVHKYLCPDEEVNCPANMTYSTCGDCAKTCRSMYLRTYCLDECQMRCQCSSNHYRTETGTCVEAADCPHADIQCPPGLVVTCGNGVLTTCSNYGSLEGTMPDKCIPTCICPEMDDVYDEKLKKCVAKSDCVALNAGRVCNKVPCKPQCFNDHFLCIDDCAWECGCKIGYSYDEESKMCEENI